MFKLEDIERLCKEAEEELNKIESEYDRIDDVLNDAHKVVEREEERYSSIGDNGEKLDKAYDEYEAIYNKRDIYEDVVSLLKDVTKDLEKLSYDTERYEEYMEKEANF